MAKKRRWVEKEIVPVEMIVWHDARKQDRESLPRTNEMILRSVGMVIDESESEVTVASECEAIEEYLSTEALQNATVDSIPFTNIIERIHLGEVRVEVSKESWKAYLKRVQAYIQMLRESGFVGPIRAAEPPVEPKSSS